MQDLQGSCNLHELPDSATLLYINEPWILHNSRISTSNQSTLLKQFTRTHSIKMLSTLLSFSALLVGSSMAQYAPAYLTAGDVWGKTCTECGMGASHAYPASFEPN